MSAQAFTDVPVRDLGADDRHRPRYHVTAPSGWLNDPNGLTERDGVYHLFFQYNPDSPVHDQIHWGHLTSTDLAHWRDEPIALAPDVDGPDADGCWSGVLVDDGGTPTFVYSGHRGDGQLPCLAVGSPDLRTWTKDPANPVIGARPEGLALTEFRDHTLWREGGRWHQLIGSGIVGTGGTVLHYASDDLRHWDFLGPLLTGTLQPAPGEPFTGSTWECPDFFGLGDGDDARQVLVFSAWDHGRTLYPLYRLGSYADGVFRPDDGVHPLDLGQRHFYAPQSMLDAAGRRLMFGWLQEARPDEAAIAAGWSGVMSVPREITVAADGLLGHAPVGELEALRGERAVAQPRTVAPGDWVDLGLHGEVADLVMRLRLPVATSALVAVRGSADGAERTVLEISRRADGSGWLQLDRSQSTLDQTCDVVDLGGPIPVSADGVVDLRVLLDASALEIFANARALAARVYPTRSDAEAISVQARGGAVEIEQAQLWQMGSAFSEER